MIDRGKKNLLGIMISALDYEAALDYILAAARERRGYSVSALAVHGVMTGVFNSQHRCRLNSLNLIAPDGQPVRWALNILHKAGLPDRVYGPTLTLKVMQACEAQRIPIYLYGTTDALLKKLIESLAVRFPDLEIAGFEQSRFHAISKEERDEIVQRILKSGARITFVAIGCPRQETWAYEFRNLLSMPVLAVGAAFPFIAGTLPQAPAWMQSRGLEWMFRLGAEPRRLWRRYVLLNPLYVLLVTLQLCGMHFRSEGVASDSGPIPG